MEAPDDVRPDVAPSYLHGALESALSGVSFLAALRPDEIGRVARRFEIVRLGAGSLRAFGASLEEARLVVSVEGRVDLLAESATGPRRSELLPGDCHGEIALLTGHTRAVSVSAGGPAVIAIIDRPGFDAVLAEFPAIALPLSSALAIELRVEHDLVRQLLELHAEGLEGAELTASIEGRRRAAARRGARVTRLSPRALFRRLITERGGEPPFWMLLGFLVSLGGARLVVFLILKYGLEKRLFALVPGTDPNPMHVHHFNYGLILIGASGVAALAPVGRKALRVLAFAFGAGAGLVFDEFGLIWNLNPEYAQPSSLISAAIAVTLLVQLTYFRHFWAALLRRGWHTLRGAR
jgi:CRP-like cAMP-binding protein